MCGIAGVFNYHHQAPVDRELQIQMIDVLAHRGPNDQGIYVCDESGISLGHRRLSIIDLSTGHQPMSNVDGTVWVVFNGEIYNYRCLRRELESLGYYFKSDSDTETIIHAYSQWETRAFSRLNGMFAFALWDARRRSLILTRDPIGIKPLYYWENGRSLVFGSEIKAILCHPQVTRELDLQALDEFLSLTFVPSPRTAFVGIRKLQPGHMLICTPQGWRIDRFYRQTSQTFWKHSENELREELRNKIDVAVRRQMVADVPIGVMLSGGVDSSTIATIMTDATHEPVETFTVGFAADFSDNEFEPARAVAQRLGSHHHETMVSANDYYAFLPRSIWHLEEPIATGSTLAFYKVCELACEHVKVVLMGQGADELFAGYHRHLGERYGTWYRALPASVRNRLVASVVSRLPRNERLKRAVRSLMIRDPLERMMHVYTILDAAFKQRLYRDGLMAGADNDGYDAVRLWQSDVDGWDGLSQMLYVDTRFSLADNLLMYSDKMSMAVALEARVPFLDLELVEFVERIPPAFKIKQWTQKYLLKKAVSTWVGREVVRRKKIGFITPVDRWFRQELRSVTADRLLAPGSACREYFKPATIQAMLHDHQSGRQDYKRALFSLLTFELWHEQFIRPSRWEAAGQTKGLTRLCHQMPR